MTFSHPLLLLTLLVVPLAFALYKLAERRRMRYAVRYTNVDLLALVAASGRPWRRWLVTGVCSSPRSRRCASRSRDRTSPRA